MFETASQMSVTAYFSSLKSSLDPKLRDAIYDVSQSSSFPHQNVHAVTCDLNSLRLIANNLCEELTTESQAQIVCHISDRVDADTAELMHTRNLTELNDWVESHWVSQVISERRLTTYFQPLICNRTNQIFAYECLMRGIEPDGQIISPLRMISAARKSGTLQSLDELARIVAIDNASKLGLEKVNYFINFSPRFMTRDMPGMQQTIDAAMNSGVGPDRFVFEVTESDEVEDIDFVIDMLQSLRECGFRIALDDIGAGYNSLTRLADIQPDYVKIDMDLIRGINEDPFKSCITSKLLELSRELEISTIVEGIETAEEWNWAKQHGADFSQGFYFAKPSAEPAREPLETLT